jgi:hypothetical protein
MSIPKPKPKSKPVTQETVLVPVSIPALNTERSKVVEKNKDTDLPKVFEKPLACAIDNPNVNVNAAAGRAQMKTLPEMGHKVVLTLPPNALSADPRRDDTFVAWGWKIDAPKDPQPPHSPEAPGENGVSQLSRDSGTRASETKEPVQDRMNEGPPIAFMPTKSALSEGDTITPKFTLHEGHPPRQKSKFDTSAPRITFAFSCFRSPE